MVHWEPTRLTGRIKPPHKLSARGLPMYSKTILPVPSIPGKITFKALGSACYVYLEIAHKFVREKGYNVPKRVIIGKLVNANDHTRMYPNENYFEYCHHDETIADSTTSYAAPVLQNTPSQTVTFKEIAPNTQKGISLSPDPSLTVNLK